MTGRVIHLTGPSGVGLATALQALEESRFGVSENVPLSLGRWPPARGADGQPDALGFREREDVSGQDMAPTVRSFWYMHGMRRGQVGFRYALSKDLAPATDAAMTRRPRCCGAGSRHAA